ncbi:hypothetical protein Q0Z83_062200 [Actinoplanes sichuanensis]|nr:hypothetical protein Q0Z83_062200 [Actinoplanes sichuanensis]
MTAPHTPNATPRSRPPIGDVEDGHRGGEHRGSADALQHAGADQRVHTRRDRAEQRGHTEEQKTDEVRDSTAVAVGEGSGAEQQCGERQGVAVQDPGQVVRAGFEVGGDAGQRDDHDRDVDEEQEGAETDGDQG